MVSEGCPHVNGYKPPSCTVPLYDFVELQTLLLREVDDKPLRDLQFRTPEGPIAKKLVERFRFREMMTRSKNGKRKMGEFRFNAETQTYILHMLVSSDGEEMCLRAKHVYNAAYVYIPVFEGERKPWNKKAYEEICVAIDRACVWMFKAVGHLKIMVRPWFCIPGLATVEWDLGVSAETCHFLSFFPFSAQRLNASAARKLSDM